MQHAGPSPNPRWKLVVADLAGLGATLLDDLPLLESMLHRGLGTRARGIVWHSHRFAPSGLSLVGASADLRIVLHTWPERGALTVDLYGSGDDLDAALGRCIEEMRKPG
jgi:S-adenosylmethionine/arginine decarboxylase-like enzyme